MCGHYGNSDYNYYSGHMLITTTARIKDLRVSQFGNYYYGVFQQFLSQEMNQVSNACNLGN